ncbi:MAG: hypothetical protein KBD76_11970 [Bacteriovorax sp.]|nr:hypothetical protein [Bacteriovorax sp.]
MKALWKRASVLSRYYFISMMGFIACWGILTILNVEFLNNLFFILAYVWHFTLLTPGLKEKMLIGGKTRFSFLSVIIRINYYLHLFIKIDKIPFGRSFVRAISPTAFTLLLLIAGGNGNIFFTLLGSVFFEFIYLLFLEKITLSLPSDPETPPEIPTSEMSHE